MPEPVRLLPPAFYTTPDGRGVMYHADCVKIMKAMKPGGFDLIFADPPFNIGYSYDVYHDSKEHDSYVKWTEEWIRWAARLLRPSGSMYVAIGDEYAASLKLALDRSGLVYRNWIIWHYRFGVYCQTKFGRNKTHIFYYVKDAKRRTWNRDAILIPSARQTEYRDKRAEKGGRVPEDCWEGEIDVGDFWDFPRVCGTFKERNDAGHPCQMPEELMDRIILTSTPHGGSVFDPFLGTATTMVSALRLGRRCTGVELSPSYLADGCVPRVAALYGTGEGQ